MHLLIAYLSYHCKFHFMEVFLHHLSYFFFLLCVRWGNGIGLVINLGLIVISKYMGKYVQICIDKCYFCDANVYLYFYKHRKFEELQESGQKIGEEDEMELPITSKDGNYGLAPSDARESTNGKGTSLLDDDDDATCGIEEEGQVDAAAALKGVNEKK